MSFSQEPTWGGISKIQEPGKNTAIMDNTYDNRSSNSPDVDA
jgi:hypothetical protein